MPGLQRDSSQPGPTNPLQTLRGLPRPGGPTGQGDRCVPLGLRSRAARHEGLLLGAHRLCLSRQVVPLPSPAPTPLPLSLPPNSKLRPPLDLERKSRILSICLRSVLALSPLDVLEKHTCLLLEPPDIQVQSWHRVPSSERGPGSARCCLWLGRGCGLDRQGL